MQSIPSSFIVMPVRQEHLPSESLSEESNRDGSVVHFVFTSPELNGPLTGSLESTYHEIRRYMASHLPFYRALVREVLLRPNTPALKVTFSIRVSLVQVVTQKKKINTFHSQPLLVDESINVQAGIEDVFSDLMNEVEEGALLTSDYLFQGIQGSTLTTSLFNARFGTHSLEHVRSVAPVGSHIPTPEWITRKHCCYNPRNSDDVCFIYCMEASLVSHENGGELPREYWQNYTKAPSTCFPPPNRQLDYSDMSFPSLVSQAEPFEKQNERKDLSLNIIVGGEKPYELSWAYRSKRRDAKWQVFLLCLFDGKTGTRHFVLVKSMKRLLFNESEGKRMPCLNCFQCFKTEDSLQLHLEKRYCENNPAMATAFPSVFDAFHSFTNVQNLQQVDVIMIVDFECLIVREEHDHAKQRHVASQAAVLSVPTFGSEEFRTRNMLFQMTTAQQEDVYIADGHLESNISTWCVEEIVRQRNMWVNLMSQRNYAIDMDADDENAFQNAQTCYACNLPFNIPLPPWMKKDPTRNKETSTTKVRDHDHRVKEDNYRGALHQFCNLKLCGGWRYDKFGKRKTTFHYKIPVLMHNFKGYDCHLIMRGLDRRANIHIIPQKGESILSISMLNLVFMDSLSLLQSSLDNAVKNLLDGREESKKLAYLVSHLQKTKRLEHLEIAKRKGVFPYEYMDSVEKFDMPLPEREYFFSHLTKSTVSEEDYDFAVSCYNRLGCRNMRDYAEWYLTLDVFLLLACVLNVRETCIAEYGLEPLRYISAPGLAFDAAFLHAQKDISIRDMLFDMPKWLSPFSLDLFHETDSKVGMYEFFEASKRGGVCIVPGRYSKASEDVDIIYLDATNLYGWAMSQPLPVKDFEWVSGCTSLDDALALEDEFHGVWLECDLHVPEKLHDYFRDYPPAPVKRPVSEAELSPYQRTMNEKTENIHDGKTNKLVLDLNDKEKYSCFLPLLKLWVSLGVEVLRVHRILRFKQYPFLKPYIEANTERRKQTNDPAKKDFYKLMNNSCYGKFLQNDRDHSDVKVLTTADKEFRKKRILSHPLFKEARVIHPDITLVHKSLAKVLLNKPIAVGCTILELSKLRMYSFYFNTIKKHFGSRARLLMSDTDSLVVEVKDLNGLRAVEELVACRRHGELDLSPYSDDHPVAICAKQMGIDRSENKGVLGKFKDESPNDRIVEFVGLRPKMYSYTTSSGKEGLRAKGVQHSVRTREMFFDLYKRALHQEMCVINMKSAMHFIPSMGHVPYTYSTTKTLLSCANNKLYICDDGVSTLPFGHHLYEVQSDAHELSIADEDEKMRLRAKGVQHCVRAREMFFDLYKRALHQELQVLSMIHRIVLVPVMREDMQQDGGGEGSSGVQQLGHVDSVVTAPNCAEALQIDVVFTCFTCALHVLHDLDRWHAAVSIEIDYFFRTYIIQEHPV